MKRIVVVVALVLLAGGASVFLLVPGGRAQVQLTIEPTMTKGAPESRVTIVEFSDYQ